MTETTGRVIPGSVTSPVGTGTVWINVEGARVEDGDYATAPLSDSTTATKGLWWKGFDFTAIPDTATIRGFQARLLCLATAAEMAKANVKLLRTGTPGTTAAKQSGFLSDVPAWIEFGNDTDLWGLSWTVAHVKSANMSILATFTHEAGGGDYEIPVDAADLAVWYTLPAPAPTVRKLTSIGRIVRVSTGLDRIIGPGR